MNYQSVQKILTLEANFILSLQNAIGENNAFFLRVNKVSDPTYIITILFPVFASLDTKLGSDILLVTAVTEWTNIALKWLIMEGRPYWWVSEYNIQIPLRQTELTCETSPGSPSGHSMCFAAFLYVFIKWCQKYPSRNVSFGEPSSSTLRSGKMLEDETVIRSIYKEKRKEMFMWVIFVILLILVCLSRVIIAAHFPHQCLFGVVLGILSAKLLTGQTNLSYRLKTLKKYQMFCVGGAFTGLAFGCYWLHHLFGYDPGWSIKLAFKWCRRPETVSVYTTPIYSIVRDCGCMVGIAFSWPITLRKFYPLIGAIVAILFFVAIRLLHQLMPTNDAFQFYTFHFLEQIVICFCFLTIIPYIASLVKVKEKQN